MRNSVHVLILSGGQGHRFGGQESKQFAFLNNKPILAHSVQSFWQWPRSASLHIVARPQDAAQSKRVIAEFVTKNNNTAGSSQTARNTSRLLHDIQFVAGGVTRHESCCNGLQAILANYANYDDDLIFIHDAARPLIQQSELEGLWQALQPASGYEIASLAAPISDSVVEADGWSCPITATLDRQKIYTIKTPQAATAQALRAMLCFSQAAQKKLALPNFTDLLSWAEYCQQKSVLVAADARNHKVTNAGDLKLLASYLL